MKAIRVNEHGGPEVLSYEDGPTPEPGAGEASVRLAASGVNFIDVYQRMGLYPKETPFTLGQEGAGEVDAVGEGVEEVSVGDHVAFRFSSLGDDGVLLGAAALVLRNELGIA